MPIDPELEAFVSELAAAGESDAVINAAIDQWEAERATKPPAAPAGKSIGGFVENVGTDIYNMGAGMLSSLNPLNWPGMIAQAGEGKTAYEEQARADIEGLTQRGESTGLGVNLPAAASNAYATIGNQLYEQPVSTPLAFVGGGSPKTITGAVGATGRGGLNAANRGVVAARDFAAANPAVGVGTGALVGGLTHGPEGAIIGALGGGTVGQLLGRLERYMKGPDAGPDVAPGIMASQLPKVRPPGPGTLRGPEPRPTVAPPPLGTLRGPEARPTVAPPPLGTLRGPTGAPVSGPGVPTSQSPPVRPPGRGKLRSYGDEEPSPTTGPGVPTSEHKKVRPPAQRERTIEEEVSERTQPPSEPARREVEKQLAEEAAAKPKTEAPPQETATTTEAVRPSKSKGFKFSPGDNRRMMETFGTADADAIIADIGYGPFETWLEAGRNKSWAGKYSAAVKAKQAREAGGK